jgi:hypothetical protein
MSTHWKLNWTRWHVILFIFCGASAGAADLWAWSAELSPAPGHLLLVMLVQSLIPLTVAAAFAHFFLYKPLQQIEAMENSTISSRATLKHPSWALPPIKSALTVYESHRLQREAYTRLTEAYRSCCLRASAHQKTADAADAFRPLIEHRLALSVTLYQFDAADGQLIEVTELEHPDADTQSPDEQLTVDDISRAALKAYSAGESEFLLGETFFQISRSTEKESQSMLLVRIRPRRLWARLPKVYRRLIQTAGDLAAQSTKLLESSARDSAQSPNYRFKRERTLYLSDSMEPQSRRHPDYLGYALHHLPDDSGDFIVIAHDTASYRTCAVLGNVPSHSLDGTLAVHGTMAIIAEILDDWHLYQPETLLERIASAVHRYHSLLLPGGPGATLTTLHFDHQSAAGNLASFGQPFPFLISPQDRRPLIVAPLRRPQEILGTADTLQFEATQFTVLSGQILVCTTAGLLATRDHRNRLFEREISQGKLATLFEERSDWTAGELAGEILSLGHHHSASENQNDDFTVITLAPLGSFNQMN